MSKKKKDKVKVRRTWKIDPRTKVVEPETKYRRTKERKNIRKEINESF